jgi:uncharacterized membrane protein YbhN (UPF0104 family)
VSEAAPSHEANAALNVDERLTEPPRRWFSPILAIPTPVIFGVAAALAILLLWRQGRLEEIADSVRDVHPARVVAILVAYAGSILLLGIRWHALVRMAGGAPHWTSSAEVFLTSVIVNYAAPIGLAVPTRAVLTIRDLELSPSQSGAVVGWEATLDVAALVVISAAWLILGGSDLVQTISVDGRVLVLIAAVTVLGVVVIRVAGRRQSVPESHRLPVACFPARPSTRSPQSSPLRSRAGSGSRKLASWRRCWHSLAYRFRCNSSLESWVSRSWSACLARCLVVRVSGRP